VIRLEHRHPEPDGPTSVASLPFASTSARARVPGGVWVKMAAEGARECRVCEGMAQFRQAGGSGERRRCHHTERNGAENAAPDERLMPTLYLDDRVN